MSRMCLVGCALTLASLLAACDKGASTSAPAQPEAPPVTYECHLVGGGSATYMRFDDKNKAVMEGREKDKLTVITAPVFYNSSGTITWSRDNTNLTFYKDTGELDWAMNGGQPNRDTCKPI